MLETIFWHFTKTELDQYPASAKILWKYFKSAPDPRSRATLAQLLPTNLALRLKDDPSSLVRLAVAELAPENYAASMIADEAKRPDMSKSVIEALRDKLPKIQRGDRAS